MPKSTLHPRKPKPLPRFRSEDAERAFWAKHDVADYFERFSWRSALHASGARNVVRRVQRTRRPVVLTQHGRSVAVLLDVREYDALLERLELLHDVQTAEKQIATGRGVAHSRAHGTVPGRLR